MTLAWTHVGDRRHCARHDKTFGLLETCLDCMVDPAPAIETAGEEPQAPPPAGCRSTEAHEREFTAIAEYAEDLARKTAAGPGATRGKTRRGKGDPKLAVKILAEAIKARRAASALARQREDDAFVARLQKRDAELRRGRH